MSGRGVSTSGVTFSMIVQKPLRPRIWLTGSRALAPGEVAVERRRLIVGVSGAVRIGEDVGAARAGGGLDQQPRVDHRTLDPAGLETIPGRRPGLDQGRAHPVSSEARRAA